ncbi:MAG TPA: nitrilase-related carbon-nitrogen hydrolase, partial [Coleofasciculaceae cyanobacterium]
MQLAIYQGSGFAVDVPANLELLAKLSATVAAQGGDFLILPELFLTGYNIGDAVWQVAEPFEGKSLQCVAQIARDHHLHLLVGYAEQADNTVYNSAALIDAEGDRVANYRKIHLFGSEERRLFTPGKHWVIQTIAGFKVGILICFDVEFPEAVRALALQGAELIAAPTANGDARISKVVVPARALENQLFIAYANRAG